MGALMLRVAKPRSTRSKAMLPAAHPPVWRAAGCLVRHVRAALTFVRTLVGRAVPAVRASCPGPGVSVAERQRLARALAAPVRRMFGQLSPALEGLATA
jgi:hypothetical protein